MKMTKKKRQSSSGYSVRSVALAFIAFCTVGSLLSFVLVLSSADSSSPRTLLQEEALVKALADSSKSPDRSLLRKEKRQETDPASQNEALVEEQIPCEIPAINEVDCSTAEKKRTRSEPTTAPWHRRPSPIASNTDGGDDKARLLPKAFLMESLKDQTQNFGVRVTDCQKQQEAALHSHFQSAMCSGDDTTACNSSKLDIRTCVSCTAEDGHWYSAVSQQNRAAFGQMNDNLSISLATTATNYKHVDIAVASTGTDNSKLLGFASRLAKGIKELNSGHLTVGLLVARHPGDDMSSQLRQKMALAAGMNHQQIRFVEIPQTADQNGLVRFNRAKALNTLHKASCVDQSLDQCLVTVVDVDMTIGASFIRNAQAFCYPRASVYFPMVFSEFNPETVQLVEESMGTALEKPNYKLPTFSPHRGVWRQFGFGLYALSGADAKDLVLDETFVGWGGEDNDFYSRVTQYLNIVRMKEEGLIHVWHPKHCTVGEFVEANRYHACIGSMSAVEGSPLGWYLRAEHAEKHGMPNKVATVESTEPIEPTISKDSKILVSVLTSRKDFKSRVGQIVNSWGTNVPASVSVLYIVGGGSELVPNQVTAGSRADVEALAKQAGLADASSILVLDEVIDNENPPVHKTAAMMKRLGEMVEKHTQVEWIFKVDDDTYVNTHSLVTFASTRNSTSPQLYGQRGMGRAEDRPGLEAGGLKKPYCLGTGYLMSRRTVLESAGNLEKHVEEIDTSKWRDQLWHNDVVMGLSIYKDTGLGCWEGDGSAYEGTALFRQLYGPQTPDTIQTFVNDLDFHRFISARPFKTGMDVVEQRRLSTKTVESPISKDSNILISVVTSRKEIKNRVGQIASSWGRNLPPSVSVVYMVGGESKLLAKNMTAGSQRDVEYLSQEAGLPSPSSVVVLKDVPDNEYPPVRRAAAMIKRLGALVEDHDNIEWVLKVDDDTYINTDALIRFTKERNATIPHFYGQRGMGRKEDKAGLEQGGLKKPFCMGGTGYLMSRSTVLQTAVGMDERVAAIDKSKWREYLWHSDVVVGLSVYQSTGLGCWEGDGSQYQGSKLFRQNYGGLSSDAVTAFIHDLDFNGTITAHPFKTGMDAVESRRRKLMAEKTVKS